MRFILFALISACALPAMRPAGDAWPARRCRRALLLMLAGAALWLPAPAQANPVSDLVPFLDAISDQELKRKLAELSSPNALSDTGGTLLHHAVCLAPDTVPTLLAAAVDPSIVDKNGNTALHALLLCDYPADDPRLLTTATQLLAAPEVATTVNLNNVSPLHLALLHAQAPSLSTASSTTLSTASSAAPSTTPSTTPSPTRPAAPASHATAASENGYARIAQLLLDRGADVTQPDPQGRYPVHLAAQADAPSLLQTLQALGADITQRDSQGRTPLWHAAGQAGGQALAWLLAQGGDVLDLDEEGDDADTSVIHRAITLQHYAHLQQLVAHQPGLALPTPAATLTLAHALSAGQRLPALQPLIDAGADPSQIHALFAGDLAWQLAEQGHLDELDFLLAHDYPLNQLPGSGFPPLYFASLEATRILLERDADPALLPRQAPGTSAAPVATANGYYQHARGYDDLNKLRQLLSHGYPVNLTGHQGTSALEWAISHNRLDKVKLLLNAEADVTLNSEGQPSLLPLAITHGRLPLVNEITNALGERITALHPHLLIDYVITAQPDPAIIELLLLRGLPVNQPNAHGQSLLHLAALNKHWALLPVLLKHGADPWQANPNGCTLQCYQWEIPKPIKERIAPFLAPPGHQATAFSPPSLNAMPAAFFVYCAIPLNLLYLLITGIQLHRRLPVLVPGLIWLLSLLTGIALSSTLFFDCDTCALPAPRQASFTMALFVFCYCMLMGLRDYRQRRRAI